MADEGEGSLAARGESPRGDLESSVVRGEEPEEEPEAAAAAAVAVGTAATEAESSLRKRLRKPDTS